jgi:hypothetical protein
MRVALEGLPGALMWSDEIGRDDAARTIERMVAADQTAALRIYVIAPPDTPAQDFAFGVVTLDDQAESDRGETRFTAPGDE